MTRIDLSFRFVLSAVMSPAYSKAAMTACVQTLFVGWGWSYIGDTFYPGKGALISLIPCLAMTLFGLNSVELTKPVLAQAGIEVAEDKVRWRLFSGVGIAIYMTMFLGSMMAAYVWDDRSFEGLGGPPFSLIAMAFLQAAYAFGYALARIPTFTVAYLTGASADDEKRAARQLYGPTALALPAIFATAYLIATVGYHDTYRSAFWAPGTFVSVLTPLLYFPYFTASAYNLLVDVREKSS